MRSFSFFLIAGSLAALHLCGCERETSVDTSAESSAPVTNRLHLSSDVVDSLGITFSSATRGRLETWLDVPGRLEVPDDHRWTVRAPASGPIAKIALGIRRCR